MTRRSSGAVLRQIHTLFTAGSSNGVSDRQLLERFVARRDAVAELAFATLVERHGPRCWGSAGGSWPTRTKPRTRFRRRFSCWFDRPARSEWTVRWDAGCTAWPRASLCTPVPTPGGGGSRAIGRQLSISDA